MSLASSVVPSNAGSDVNLTEKPIPAVNEKEVEAIALEKENSSKRDKEKEKKKQGRSFAFGLFSYFVSNKDDVEKTADGPSPRPMRLIAPLYCGVSAAMSFCK